MGSNWKTYTLDELYEVSSGLSKKREEFGFGYPFLTFKEVFHNIFVPEVLPELANTTEKERKRCSVKKGDVFLTRTSEKLEELGLSCVALKDYKNATFNGFTKRLRPNSLCKEILLPEYAAFYFSSNTFRNQVTSFASMTTRASLNNEMISKLKIDIPSLYVQEKIANLMQNLLKKELLNNQIIKNLESIASELFKRWFINFEFPNEQGLPYRSSGGEMVESELGEIPEKWGIFKIGDLDVIISDHVANGSFKSLKDNVIVKEEEDYALFLRNVDLKANLNGNLRYVPKESYDFLKKSRLDGGEVIISNVGDVGTVHRCPKLDKPMVLGNNQIFLKSKETYINNYLYMYFKSFVGQHLIDSITSGSVQLKFNKTDFRSSIMIFPSIDDLKNLMEPLNKLLDKIEILSAQNKKLEELRKSILPKLLSGEIKIPDESVVDSK